jgi:hypothetical protein
MYRNIDDSSHGDGVDGREVADSPHEEQLVAEPALDAHAGTGTAVADPAPPAGRTIRLEAPGTGVRDTWRAMGPGIAAAMTGIGASHIIHGPTAGAEWGYALLWVIPVAYLLKYCAFEFAHRYTIVKGESIFEAYERIGRGKGEWTSDNQDTAAWVLQALQGAAPAGMWHS